MEHRYLITIDVGTSSTKTVLWDEAGRLVAETSFAYPLNRPDPLWAEIDGNLWWEAVCATIHHVVARGGINPAHVVGLGVDGVSWTLLSVDRDVTPLHPAMIWLDRRAERETDWLNALPEAGKLVALVANPIDSAYITPKLLWLKNHHPEIFEAAYKFLTCSGFIVARLTGEFTCDYTQAYGYHFFDIAHECWDTWAAQRIGIPLDKMPRLCACTDLAGTLAAQAAVQTGLPAGIPVIAGCLDAASGALGSGVTRLGQTNEQGGQAGGMAVSLDHVVVEPQLIFSHHVMPGQYILQAGTVGGGSLGWFRDVLGQVETTAGQMLGLSPFELISRQVEQTPAGAHGLIFLPYMAGERTPLWSRSARGVFFGLSYNTTRGDLLRAIMEGCAFAVYDNLHIAAEKGVRVSEYLGSGGATQSAVWCQIKADVSNIPFIVARRADGGEGGHSLGLYALTAHAVGLWDDIGACVERLLPKRQVFEPSPPRHAMYEDLFEVYRSVSRRSLADFDRLAAVAQEHQLIKQED
ncbi:MAG TPA: FGGY family carbohydrate kinase [Aggregatilineales bacterium]|nr:FGGY family carbohydrate kinase [Aggregatilineales bacterium]